jgi:hypothetical protein
MIAIAWIPFLTFIIAWNLLLNKKPDKTGRIFAVVIGCFSFFVLGALVTGYAKNIRPGTLIWEIKEGPVKSEYYLLGHGKYHFSNGSEAAIPTNGSATILINNIRSRLQIDKIVYLRDGDPMMTLSPLKMSPLKESSTKISGELIDITIEKYGFTRDYNQTAAKKLRRMNPKEASSKISSQFINAMANELSSGTYAIAAPYTLVSIPRLDYLGIEKEAPPQTLALTTSSGGLSFYAIRYWVYQVKK